MSEERVMPWRSPGAPGLVANTLTELLREGARRMLAVAIEAEVRSLAEPFSRREDGERTAARGAQRALAGTVDPDRDGAGGGLGAEGAGPGGEDPVHVGDLAALFAAQADAGGVVALAVFEGRFDRGFPRGADGAAGTRCAGVVGEHDQPVKGHVERGARADRGGIEPTGVMSLCGPTTSTLACGWRMRRYAFWWSLASRRRKKSAFGLGRRLPRQRSVLAGGAFGPQGARADGPSPTRRR